MKICWDNKNYPLVTLMMMMILFTEYKLQHGSGL
jgi:hypothetical protein